MTSSRRLSLLFILLLAGGVAAAEMNQELVVTPRLPFAKILPGVPFEVEFTIENRSQRYLTVGLGARIHARRSDGTELVTDEQGTGLYARVRAKPSVPPSEEIAPGETIAAEISIDRLPGWTALPFLSGPGTYDIAFDLQDHFEEAANYVGSIRTGTVRLERLEPSGLDGELWARMQQVAKGRWSDAGFSATREGEALAKEIIRSHESSAYYPYALLSQRYASGRDHMERLLRAAERFPESPALGHLLKRAGDLARKEAQSALQKDDQVGARELFDIAERSYERALKTNLVAVRAETKRAMHLLAAERTGAAR